MAVRIGWAYWSDTSAESTAWKRLRATLASMDFNDAIFATMDCTRLSLAADDIADNFSNPCTSASSAMRAAAMGKLARVGIVAN